MLSFNRFRFRVSGSVGLFYETRRSDMGPPTTHPSGTIIEDSVVLVRNMRMGDLIVSGVNPIDVMTNAVILNGMCVEVDDPLFPTTSSWYADASKSTIVARRFVERAAGSATKLKPTQVKWQFYDDAGDVVATCVDNIVYSGTFPINMTRTFV